MTSVTSVFPDSIPVVSNHFVSSNSARMRIMSAAARSFLALGAALVVNVAVITFVAQPLSLLLISELILFTGVSLILKMKRELTRISHHLSETAEQSVTSSSSSIPLALSNGQCSQDIENKSNATSYSSFSRIGEKYGLTRIEKAVFDGSLPSFEREADVAMLSLAEVVHGAGVGIGIHEAGHALAAKACFEGVNPKIKIFPFRGGVTSFLVPDRLTKFGKLLGLKRALLFFTAAGVMASALSALVGFTAGDYLKEHFPVLGKFITCFSISQIANEIFYGLSAFFADPLDLSHDFVSMWAYGIHPLIPLALITSLFFCVKKTFGNA